VGFSHARKGQAHVNGNVSKVAHKNTRAGDFGRGSSCKKALGDFSQKDCLQGVRVSGGRKRVVRNQTLRQGVRKRAQRVPQPRHSEKKTMATSGGRGSGEGERTVTMRKMESCDPEELGGGDFSTAQQRKSR